MLSLVSAGATVAYRVNYDGKVIATVKNKQQFAQALSIVKQRVNGIDIEQAVSEPSYAAALVHSSVIDSEDTVADAIIENTEEIVYASALYVNGEFIACVEEGLLADCLEQCRTRFDTPSAECEAEFVDDIKIESGYYLAGDIKSFAEIRQTVAGLAVKTVASIVTDSSIAYETVTEKTDELIIGDSAVVTEGKEGTRRITESVTFINGVEVAREQLSNEVVSEPVKKVVRIGTARTKASASEKQYAKSTGFLFPLPKGSWTVTSYYGDGRGHQGMDLGANKGVSVFAVADGTIISAGWNGAYGYCVEIKHSDGLVTLYGHASSLCVSVGDSVSAGDVIAKVGSTGRSSGNHLHFEVIKGGVNVDPAPYIGLD